jgi:hypothetical protein
MMACMMGLPGTYNEQNASSRQAASQPAASRHDRGQKMERPPPRCSFIH